MKTRIRTVSLGQRPVYFSLERLMASALRFSMVGAMEPKHIA